MTEDKYHHGDLRNAIIAESMNIIRAEGIGSLSIRRVAKRVGVSHTAPYRHFRNREDLLAALAVKGFDMLQELINAALSANPADSRAQVVEAGKAYIRFATRHPDYYRLMFRDPIRNKTGHATLFAKMDGFFQAWVRLVAAMRPGEPAHDEDHAVTVLAAWSLLHGYASLVIDNEKDPLVGSDHQILQIARKLVDVIGV